MNPLIRRKRLLCLVALTTGLAPTLHADVLVLGSNRDCIEHCIDANGNPPLPAGAAHDYLVELAGYIFSRHGHQIQLRRRDHPQQHGPCQDPGLASRPSAGPSVASVDSAPTVSSRTRAIAPVISSDDLLDPAKRPRAAARISVLSAEDANLVQEYQDFGDPLALPAGVLSDYQHSPLQLRVAYANTPAKRSQRLQFRGKVNPLNQDCSHFWLSAGLLPTEDNLAVGHAHSDNRHFVVYAPNNDQSRRYARILAAGLTQWLTRRSLAKHGPSDTYANRR